MKIQHINDLMNAVYAVKKKFGGQHLWWRGHAKMEWNVEPHLFHKGFAENEGNLSHLFVNKAKVRHAKCPDPNDLPTWLFLMQHCGLPTRLLNWSESILVAAYFVVSDKKYLDQPGALWALEPSRLNEFQIQRKCVLVHQDDHARELFEDAFKNGEEKKSDKTLAVWTDQMDVRQVVQFSTFTIHGSDVALNQHPAANKYLFKYEIPYDAKPQLLQALELLGIKKSFLFPDLEHLADDLKNIMFE